MDPVVSEFRRAMFGAIGIVSQFCVPLEEGLCQSVSDAEISNCGWRIARPNGEIQIARLLPRNYRSYGGKF